MDANAPKGGTALLVLSDLHINSTVAVCPPTINLDDGGTYHASRTQRWLYEVTEDIKSRFIRDAGKRRKIVIFNGDLGELDTKRRSIQLISLNKATIQRMAFDTIEPIIDIADSVYIIRGTAAHNGKSDWLEEAIAQDLSNVIPSATDIYSHWQVRRETSGIRLDIAHHAGMGGKPWARKNAANNKAAELLWDYRVAMQQEPPHLAVRSHNHSWADSGDNFETRVIYTPCLTTMTEFAYRCGWENKIPDIGGLCIICENASQQVIKYANYQPRETKKIWRNSL